MSDAALANAVAYCLQAACIVVAGSALPLVLRTSPSFLYGWWRCLLVVALAMPWLYHGAPTPATGSIQESSTVTGIPGGTLPAVAVSDFIERALPWTSFVVVAVIAGMLLHLAWMCVGLLRLRRLRHAGQDADATPVETWLHEILGTRAKIRFVDSLEQPVTFGLLDPVVLLPASLRDEAPDIQRAVLCHELVHVQRRDWAWLVAEELLRATFWFHPVVRWLLTRIQLTREEVVDEVAVAACGGNRRTYAAALIAFADDTRFTPAVTFSRRRHLYHRILRLSQESVMSFRRLASVGSITVGLVAVASWLGAEAFPTTAVAAASQLATTAGPLEQAAYPVTPENPIPALTLSTLPTYPAAAKTQNVDVVLTMLVTLDQFGRVAEMRRLNFLLRKPMMFSLAADPMPSVEEAIRARTTATTSSTPALPPEVREAARRMMAQRTAELTALAPSVDAMFAAAADAVSGWQYAPPVQAPLSLYLRFAFTPESQEAQLVEHGTRSPLRMTPVETARAVPPSSGSAGARSGRAGSIGSNPTPAPGAPTPGTVGVPAVRVGGQSAPASRIGGGSIPPLRVGGDLRPPLRTKHVPPVYPAVALAARIQGVVIAEATVGPDGRVTDARILRSIPLLDAAALEAVRQWEYVPTLLNGAPVPVIMTVTVQFSLGGEAGAQTSQSGPTAGVRIDGNRMLFSNGTPLGGSAALRVGGATAVPIRLKHVAPVYPPEAREARIQGVVIIEATVGADGRVSDARVLRSIPQLDEAALDAVRQWEYQPTLLNGVPTAVIMTTTVQFTLAD